MAPKDKQKRPSKLFSMLRRKSGVDAPDMASKMGNVDAHFFGEEEEESLTGGGGAGSPSKSGLLSGEAEQADTAGGGQRAASGIPRPPLPALFPCTIV